MNCVHCGTWIAGGARFCNACGKEVPANSEKQEAPLYYEHSGKSSKLRAFIGFAVSVAMASPVAWLYAYGQFRVPYTILRAAMPFLFGSLLGFGNAATLRLAKVRSRPIARRMTFGVTTIAYYLSWAAWVGMGLREQGMAINTLDVALQPISLARTIIEANRVGRWTFMGSEFGGILLWVVWLVEFLVIFFMGVQLGRDEFLDLPFCERCDRWCKKHANIVRFWHPDEAVVKRAVQTKDFESLASFEPVPLTLSEGRWYECTLEICPTCTSTNTLDVFSVTAERNKKNEVSCQATQIISNLMLTAVEVDGFRRLGDRIMEPGLILLENGTSVPVRFRLSRNGDSSSVSANQVRDFQTLLRLSSGDDTVVLQSAHGTWKAHVHIGEPDTLADPRSASFQFTVPSPAPRTTKKTAGQLDVTSPPAPPSP